jgi:hypothetical protein
VAVHGRIDVHDLAVALAQPGERLAGVDVVTVVHQHVGDEPLGLDPDLVEAVRREEHALPLHLGGRGPEDGPRQRGGQEHDDPEEDHPRLGRRDVQPPVEHLDRRGRGLGRAVVVNRRHRRGG